MTRRRASSSSSTPKRTYTRRQTTAEKYFKAVANGKIVACQKLVKVAKMLVPRFKDGYKKWHYDRKAARKPVEFIERYCRIPSGKLGAPFVLEDYEKALIEVAFGFVDDEGNRQFREVFVIWARKSGKTSLCAAIELYMLVADREGAPQIYNIATSKEQASLAYGACVKIFRMSKELSSLIRKGTVVERHQDGLICDANMGYITPLSSQTRHLDGLDVHCVVVDELAAFTNRDVYDLVKQGTGAREQPMVIEITTNGFERGNVFDSQYDYAMRLINGEFVDDHFLPLIYELDERSEWTDPKAWKKANPGLGTVKKMAYLEGEVNKAKNDPSYLPTVLTKEFNVPENRASAWLRFEEAVNEETFDIDEMGFRYGVAGFDYAETTDLAAGKMLMMRPDDDHIYEASMYWIPESKLNRGSGYRKSADDVPYELWEKRGLMRVVPGNKVYPSVFLEWLEELRAEHDVWTFAIGVDPWHITGRDEQDFIAYVGESRYEKVRQGAITLSQPMGEFRADLAAKRFVNNHNPIDEWCRMNVAVRIDVNSNMQPDKSGNNPKNKIDGFMAELDAYIALKRHYDEYTSNL